MNDSHPSAGQPRQLSLNIQLGDQATFDNFFVAVDDQQSVLVSWLRNWARQTADKDQEPFAFLWGATGSGRSHLLKACCHQAALSGELVHYLPLADLLDYQPEALLEGMAASSLLCVDDIHLIEGRTDWEQALFNLYNQIRDSGQKMLVSSSSAPRSFQAMLPDLVSRLSWGPVFKIPELDDEQKEQVLISRADMRGIVLNDDVAGYLIKRVSRDMPALMALLDKLDRSSLEHKRALTIPFVKSLLDEGA